MQVSCWLHAGFADLAYWCVTSMTTPWNLHGICMEPPWNLYQAECMVKPTNIDTWNLNEIYINSPWNLHGTCMKTASVRRRHATITFRHKKQRNRHETSMKPTSILHGTCMDTPSMKRHTSTRCRYREQRLFFFNGNYMETIRRFDANQIDGKLVVKKNAQKVS